MKKKLIILISILLVIVGVLAYLNTFKIEEIKVSGCEYSDPEQIKDAVRKKSFTNNTLILYLVNKFDPVQGIQYVDKVEIEYLSKNTVSVTVFEKSLAGCVEYMNGYVYFDKDGVILESSSKKLEDIPFIKGLEFNQWEIGQKLPIEDEAKFKAILSVTQLIDKYELSIDGIKFTAENEIVLTQGGITIELGEGEYLEIQMMNLGSILSGLEGKEGTLYMKDFDSDDATASFKEITKNY